MRITLYYNLLHVIICLFFTISATHVLVQQNHQRIPHSGKRPNRS
jgi:hypothetical protein